MSWCRTYTMPCGHSRSSTGFGPGDRSGQGGRSGSIRAHKPSSTIQGRVVTQRERPNHHIGHARPGQLNKILLRALWRCDGRALYRCPDTQSRCGKMHVTPEPKDLYFDDLVRQTAAGLIVPIQIKGASRTNRHWVTAADRDRYADFSNGLPLLPPVELEDQEGASSGASHRAPTCRNGMPLGLTRIPAQLTSSAAATDAWKPPGSTASLSSRPPFPDTPVRPPASELLIPQQPGPVAGSARDMERAHSAPDPTKPGFPGDLLIAQTRLHQATAQLAAVPRSLPWSTEPMAGWPTTRQAAQRNVVAGREASSGWSQEETDHVEQLRHECRRLSESVLTHAHWKSVPKEHRVAERMRLKGIAREMGVPGDVQRDPTATDAVLKG